jgi:hypothetical protein
MLSTIQKWLIEINFSTRSNLTIDMSLEDQMVTGTNSKRNSVKHSVNLENKPKLKHVKRNI